MTDLYDQRERESRYALCPKCGEDPERHTCADELSERTLRIRELNDEFRTDPHRVLARMAGNELVITRGVAAHGYDFGKRALDAVRAYADFSAENDPHGEHDFGRFTLDGADIFWKIDYYDNDLRHGSPNPADAALTKRVLTILLAEEY